MRKNKHIGSSFGEFLKDEGIYEDVTAVAVKRAIAVQIAQEMEAQVFQRRKWPAA